MAAQAEPANATPAPWLGNNAAVPEPVATKQPRPDLGSPFSGAPALVAPAVKSSRRWWAGLLVALLVLVALVGGVALGHRDGSSAVEAGQLTGVNSSSQPASTPANGQQPTEAPTEAPAEAPAPPPDPEPEALSALRQQRATDLANTPLDGQWVAQLASKYDGIVDPLQTSASGSHTFHNVDILAEFRGLQGLNLGGANLALLLSTDYGQRRTVSGHVLWVTFALPGLSSKSEVESWCGTSFAPLTGQALLNVCAARQLNAPS